MRCLETKKLKFHRNNMLKQLVCFVLLLGTVFGKSFVVENKRSETIWVGILGTVMPHNGGVELPAGQTITLDVGDSWSGRVWGRTGCSFDESGNGHCETADCSGGKLECNGGYGEPPASLAEFTMGPDGDFYDDSLVDGFNLPLTITPLTQPAGSDHYRCGVAGCSVDLNANCPEELRLLNGAGKTVGCKSACATFNTDEYCCRGDHGTPDTCKSSDWPVNYPKYFKDACPDAYSYAYDDQSSTFTCNDSGYRITFT